MQKQLIFAHFVEGQCQVTKSMVVEKLFRNLLHLLKNRILFLGSCYLTRNKNHYWQKALHAQSMREMEHVLTSLLHSTLSVIYSTHTGDEMSRGQQTFNLIRARKSGILMKKDHFDTYVIRNCISITPWYFTKLGKFRKYFNIMW